jgi:hypothetical protein
MYIACVSTLLGVPHLQMAGWRDINSESRLEGGE